MTSATTSGGDSPTTVRTRTGGSASERAPRGRGRPSARRRRFPVHIVVFLAPAVIIYSMFMVYPLLDSLRLSLFDDGGSYVGFANFDTLFNDPLWSNQFWNALGNNFLFFAFHMLVQNPVGLLLAVLLTAQGVRWQSLYRTAIFIPTTLSVVIVGFIWRQILSPLWGIIDTPLLGEAETVLPTLSLISVWQFVGMPMIFFYAVLIAIPIDLIEAARVDGATSWQIFRRITFPLVLPMLGIITIVTYVANFNAFDLIFTVKGALAGPDFSADILGTLFYRSFFGNQLRAGSAAMGATVASAMFLIILLGVLVYTFAWQRRVTTYEL
ncbi:MAG: carbohydrate ABC transporter permease [Acidimicrobiales bacterium]